MSNIKNLAAEIAKLTSEEIGALAAELNNLGASACVTAIDPPRVPPIGGGFPGDWPPTVPTPGTNNGDNGGNNGNNDDGNENDTLTSDTGDN